MARVVVRGLGSTEAHPRTVKGRGYNERERLRAREDARATRRAALGLGRSVVREKCVDEVKAARELGALEVEREREARDELEAGARSKCADVRAEVRALPKDERKRDLEALRGRVRAACVDGVDEARAAGRSRVEGAKAARRARTGRALEDCAKTRLEVPEHLRKFIEETDARERALLRELLQLQAPVQKPRTSKQYAADLARKHAAKASRKRRGPSVAELVDMGRANVAPEWQWLWKRMGAKFVREARMSTAKPEELFAEYLEGHGVEDQWTQSPGASDLAEDYERIVESQLSDRERDRAVEETMDALGLSRSEAEDMVDGWAKANAKRKKKAGKKPKKASAPAYDDDDPPF